MPTLKLNMSFMVSLLDFVEYFVITFFKTGLTNSNSYNIL